MRRLFVVDKVLEVMELTVWDVEDISDGFEHRMLHTVFVVTELHESQ